MIVKLDNISKSFKHQPIINNINITFKPKKIYGIIGRNGSGKTVLLKMICGILKPDSGKILFDNEDYINKFGVPKSTRALIESPEMINDLSGFENLKLIASIKNEIDDKQILKTLEIVGLKNEEYKKYKNYSLGMKQKLGIAQVLMEDADLIILDEPFNGLDDKSANNMRNLIKSLKANKIIIVATHIKDDIENLIDDLYKIDGGNLIYERKN